METSCQEMKSNRFLTADILDQVKHVIEFLDFDYTDVSLQFIAWKYIDEATAEPGSRLLAYFECVKQSRLPNAERPLETSVYKFKSANDLTYSEMPSHYVYKNKKWNMRKKN